MVGEVGFFLWMREQEMNRMGFGECATRTGTPVVLAKRGKELMIVQGGNFNW